MRTFTLALHDEDGHIWAEVNELPGCFVSGRDMEEFKKALAEAIGMYVEGLQFYSQPETLRAQLQQQLQRSGTAMEILNDTADLVIDLWPKPRYASVTLETHQWVKLRRVLLSIPDLLAQADS